MKKTLSVKLVIVSAVLASCHKPEYQQSVYEYPQYPDSCEYNLTDSCNISSQDYQNLWFQSFRIAPWLPYFPNYYVAPKKNGIVLTRPIRRGGFSSGSHSAGA